MRDKVKRIVIPIVILFLIVGVSFSSFDFEFTEGFNTKNEMFYSDKIKLLNYDYGSDCKFNYTLKHGGTVVNKGNKINCGDSYSIKIPTSYQYSDFNITVVEYNNSNPSRSNTSKRTIHTVYCKGTPKISVPLNDSSTNPPTIAIWPNVSVSNFTCNPPSDVTFYFYSNISLVGDKQKQVYNGNSFTKELLFSKPGTAKLWVTMYNGYESKSSQVIIYKIDNCKPSDSDITQNPQYTCPNSKYSLTINFPNYCKGDYVNICVKNITSDICKSLSSTSLIFNNLYPPAPDSNGNFETKIQADVNEHGLLSTVWEKEHPISTNPQIGISSASTEVIKNLQYDCYDQNELGIPCDFSYLINVSLFKPYLPFFYYTILMNVTYPDGYVDQYAKEVNGFQSNVYFGFDGYTNQTCNYTFSHDISCNVNSNGKYVCTSKNTGNSFTSSGICPTNPKTFQFKCPAPTVQKRWHEVETIALPLHFTFGIYNKSENYHGFDFGSEPFQLYRLGGGKVRSNPSSEVNVTMKVYRYKYQWSITPFNWLVNVLARNDFIPIRIGFNQTLPQTLNGVGKLSSFCSGNSTCYTEVPLCGDGVCDYASGETCKTCPQDCACAPNTLGCYGQYIPNFTDQRGCIVRFKQYEESCHVNEECNSSLGLVCQHKYLGNHMEEVGHCCKPDEIWDPTTKNLQDANPKINGTCRVPRGVYIENITVKDWQGNDGIADIYIKVHTSYAKDRVCALFATDDISYAFESCDLCSSAGWAGERGWDKKSMGGATQYCVVPNSNEYTFHFKMDDAAPHYHYDHSEYDMCVNYSNMVFAVYLPYQLNSSHPEYGDWTNQWYFDRWLALKGNGVYLSFPDFIGIAGNVFPQPGDVNPCLTISKCCNRNTCDYCKGDCSVSYNESSVFQIKTADSPGNTWITYFNPFNGSIVGGDGQTYYNWTYVNGHYGNILKDEYGNERFAEIVTIGNQGKYSSPCQVISDNYAGECDLKDTSWSAIGGTMDPSSLFIVFPYDGDPTPDISGDFVCGGNKMKPASDW